MTRNEDRTTMVQGGGFGGGQLVLAFLGGAVAGVVGALLFAPRSGAETREMLGKVVAQTKGHVVRLPQAIIDAGLAAKEAFVDEQQRMGTKSRNGKVSHQL